MVDANEKDEAPKLNSSPEKDEDISVIVSSTLLSNMQEEEEKQEQEDEDEDEDPDENDEEYEDEEEEDEYDEEEEEVEEEDEYDEDGKEPDKEGEDANNEITTVIVEEEGTGTNEEHNKGKAIGEEKTNKENNVKEDAVKGGDEKKAEQKKGKELGENSKKKGKIPRPRNSNKKKVEEKALDTLAANGDKPESSRKKSAPKRVESMGMVFMCSSKTKTDCFRYKILGLPANKKDQVAKIYKGMRLFLFDVDLRLMYGIFKAAGPGGYNIEPKAFKSDFPSQVRFTVLDDCLPLAEERFKDVIRENYFTRNKFEGLLKAEQVKKLCKLFVAAGGKGGPRPKAALKPLCRTEPVESRRRGADDLLSSRDRKKRKRRPLEEDRRPRSPRSPRGRDKRRYTDYERAPIIYEHEPPIPRYLPLPLPLPPPVASPVRSYPYERPLDPYMRDPLLDHRTYRVLDVEARHHDEIWDRDRDWDRNRDRAREGYYVISREAPPYREAVYTLPPEYHLVGGRDYRPPADYRVSGGSRVPGYDDVGLPAPDHHRSPIHEYRSHRTHYRY